MNDTHDIAHDIAAAVRGRGRTIAAAESVSAGQVATALAAAPGASEWFSASVVAYGTPMKRQILGVKTDTVISHMCAREMAEGALRLTSADLVVSVTGVGGPDAEEGRPPGTVIICAGSRNDLRIFDHAFDGSPEQVVQLATVHALQHLRDAALLLQGGAS